MRAAVVVTSLLLVAFPARASETQPSTAKLGSRVEPVRFVDAQGQPVTLHRLQGKKATVVVFLSFDCPVSRDYCQGLAELARTHPDAGVVGVVCTTDETPAEVARKAAEFKLPFPVFRDENRKAADALKAETTPEAFVLDAGGVLRYRGRIDNAYAARLKRNRQVTRHDLRQALDEVLAGKPVTEPATLAVGCPIVRDTAAKAAPAAVTYYRDVLPILQNNCQTCHRPGEVGPFPLMTYKQAVAWAADIKDFTQAHRMPPWKVNDGPAFHNERRLSETDIATLAAWADGGTPAGDPKDAPPSRRFIDGWQLGQPDLVLMVEKPFQLGATGNDLFRCFVLPTNLPEDKYVVAVEIRPGNPRIVHHALLAIDTTGTARKLDQAERAKSVKETDTDRGPGYPVAMGFGFLPQGGMSGWAPGQMPRVLPQGAGYYLPRGADVVMQVHYHRDGKVETDRCQLGLYFAREPVAKRFQGLAIPGGQRGILGRTFFTIPAGAEHYRLGGSIWVDQDCTLHAITPHMHMIGKEIKVTMTPPDGKPQTLIAIPEWDYNWQETYFFKEPIHVAAGTRFDVEAYYDNSAKNPSNPNSPPRRVSFGQQTTDEMCFVFLGATSDKPGRLRPRFEAPKKVSAP